MHQHHAGMDDQVSETGKLRVSVPWSAAVSDLDTQGWAFAPNAVNPTLLLEAVSGDKDREWLLRSGKEGVAHQHAYTTGMNLVDAPLVVRDFGDCLVAGLSDAARLRRLAALPEFNEVTWSRYPTQTGHITAHRDPPAYGGVIAVATLDGQATFRVVNGDGTAHTWETAPGQLVLLCGAGWPSPDSRCPVHEAMAPSAGERTIITFRHNSAGAGAGYVV